MLIHKNGRLNLPVDSQPRWIVWIMLVTPIIIYYDNHTQNTGIKKKKKEKEITT